MTNQQKCSINRLKLIKKCTLAEITFKQILDNSGIKNIFQKGFIKNNKCFIVDFYIPTLKLCIEIDGEYHNDENQKKYDLWREQYLLNERNFRLIRFSNNFVFNNKDKIIKIIKESIFLKKSNKICYI
jgi:very-short-patch-repair endonuclease